jgi:hypothetical protein
MARAPGSIRDAIIAYMSAEKRAVTISQIREAVAGDLGEVAPSSVRSYLNLNCPALFERVGRGQYKLRKNEH